MACSTIGNVLAACIVSVSGDEFFAAANKEIPTLRGLKHTTPEYGSMNNIVIQHDGKFNLMLGSDEVRIKDEFQKFYIVYRKVVRYTIAYLLLDLLLNKIIAVKNC